MKGQTYVILGIIVLIIVSIFAVTNVATVKVNYLFWSGESPLILVILFSVLMGGLIMAAVSSFKYFHLQREIKALKIQNQQYETVLKEHNLLEIVEKKPKENGKDEKTEL